MSLSSSRIGRAKTAVPPILFLCCSISLPSHAQPPSDDLAKQRITSEVDRVTLSLLHALETRLTVWRSPKGKLVHVQHCRAGRGGCRPRLAVFARWLVDVTSEHELDPFLLAAVALRESGLNPLALGGAGEMGIVQLHPRGVGRRSKFVRSGWYRRFCARSAGACQREVLEIGAEHLSSAIGRCGSVEAGLGAYNSGKCGATMYSQQVMREHRKLKRLAVRDAASTTRRLN